MKSNCKQVNSVGFNLEFELAPESIEDLVTKDKLMSQSEMILKVKKPDYLGESKWDFRHGGRSFPAKILHSECLNHEVFTSLAPFADDIWFKAMSLLNGVKCKKVNDNREFWNRFLTIPYSQDVALMSANLLGGGNDYQIKKVFEEYNLIRAWKYNSE